MRTREVELVEWQAAREKSGTPFSAATTGGGSGRVVWYVVGLLKSKGKAIIICLFLLVDSCTYLNSMEIEARQEREKLIFLESC